VGTGIAVSVGAGVLVGTDVAVLVGSVILVGTGVEVRGATGEPSLGLLVAWSANMVDLSMNASTSSTAVPGFAKVILMYLAITGSNCA
jgi:hypothetical protein